MPANQNPAKLMVALENQTVCIKVNGRADFTSSVDLKKLIAGLWHQGYDRFVFELCDCVTMDSTFLGLLSGIGLKFSEDPEKNSAPLELRNPNPRIAETLENLGVADLFAITNCAETLSNKFQPLSKSPDTTQKEITETCYEAHKTLISIQPENAPKFKDVVAFLAEDLKRMEAKDQLMNPDAPAHSPDPLSNT